MNRATFILFLILILAIGGGSVWYLMQTREASLVRPEQTSTTTSMLNEGKAIYTNGPYGFMVLYPETSDVGYEFSSAYHLGSSWRANALPESTGIPIVEIVPYSVASDHSYPRYFTALVRVGASEDPKELANCLKATPNQGETALPDVTINDTTFKAFSFQNAGMMQYVSGVSYRVLHEGKCIAVEKIRTGSSYREDAPSTDDVPDSVLDSRYQALDQIIESFKFVR